uniref:Uncharacterized protein n=1 Tax=Triticum urartu TaxID=4572 RepID=A0A8R7TU51_TRIUA
MVGELLDDSRTGVIISFAKQHPPIKYCRHTPEHRICHT